MSKLKEIKRSGVFESIKVEAYSLEYPDDSKHERDQGISRDDFHSILNKASQPIKEKKKDKGE